MRAKGLLVMVAVWSFVLGPVFTNLVWAAEVILPSGEVVNMTPAQLEALKSQAGIQVVETVPAAAELHAGAIAIEVPSALGGGAIIGTPQAIAAGFNAAGITAGLTAAAVTGAAVLTTAAIAAGAAVAAFAIAEALAGEAAEEDEDEAEEAQEAAAHHAAAHHAAGHHAAAHH